MSRRRDFGGGGLAPPAVGIGARATANRATNGHARWTHRSPAKSPAPGRAGFVVPAGRIPFPWRRSFAAQRIRICVWRCISENWHNPEPAPPAAKVAERPARVRRGTTSPPAILLLANVLCRVRWGRSLRFSNSERGSANRLLDGARRADSLRLPLR